MAWIVKPSATATIQTRSKPYLTDAMRKSYTEELIPRYERPQGALMPILTDVQQRYAHVPHQAMVEIGELLGIHPGEVLDTVSFYEGYTTEPVGKYVVGVCQSIACEVCGHEAILDHLRAKLGVEPHETTEDGRFTLLAMECLGACEGAPCALINGDRYDNLTIESIDQLLENLK